MDSVDTDHTDGWTVDTLDVGQADAHLLETTEQTKILIDTDEDRIVSTLDSLDTWDTPEKTSTKTIDKLLSTHIHDDHIAGVQYLKEGGYTVHDAYRPPADRYMLDKKGGVDRTVLGKYLEGLAKQGIEPDEIEPVYSGDKILEEEAATLTALSPPATAKTVETTSQSSGQWCTFKPEKANGNGVVCKFEGPDNVSGLFMGDVGDESAHNAESWLIEQHNEPDSDVDLNTDILFLGHHGSNNSTGKKFLDAVAPDHVVISSSLDNNYTSKSQYDGHPHDETLERLHDREIDIHWTAVHGTINTTVEAGSTTLDHATTIETTEAADLAALKYYGQENDLDQQALAEIEEISLDDLPEETPEWVSEASLVTEQAAIDPEKIEELTELETERSGLKREKYRLEGTRTQRLERKAALEQEAETNQGVTDRLTAAVGSLWGAEDATDEAVTRDTTTDHRSEEPASTVEETQNSAPAEPAATRDPDADPPDDDSQQDDIDATIAAYERQNAALRTEISDLTEQVEGLTTRIESLEDELENPGLLNRVTAAIGSDAGDTKPTEIRRARFSETAASLADTDVEEHAEPANAEQATQEKEQAKPRDHTPDQARSASTHQEQDSRDRSGDRGLSL